MTPSTDFKSEQELLQSFRPWLRTVAAGFPETKPSRVEELAQEGWVAVWRAINGSKDDRPLEPFLKQCAINRMRDVFRQWTEACRNVYMTHSVDMTPGEINLWEALCADLGDIASGKPVTQSSAAICDQKILVLLGSDCPRSALHQS
jgi:DNA-directed RNA polymerase specialized sigma24 family protein